MKIFTRVIARGLAVGLPLILTLAILVWLLETIETWLGIPMRWMIGDAYLPGMGLLLGLAIIIGLGLAASTWLGGKLLDLVNAIVERVPLVKTIYSAIKDVFSVFGKSGGDAFDKAVIVEWGGRRFLGFITRDNRDGLPDGLMGDDDVIVYLPMGYQIGGFPIIVARDQLTSIDMPVDVALKFALTAGGIIRKEMIRITRSIWIDPDELEEQFVRASGPGGQNVNKVSSAVQLRFDIRHSPSLPRAVAARAEKLAGKRLTREGVIVISADRFRTQERNRQDALDRLKALLEKAAKPPVPRRPTKPTKGSKRRRLESKKQRGKTKGLRGSVRSSEF